MCNKIKIPIDWIEFICYYEYIKNNDVILAEYTFEDSYINVKSKAVSIRMYIGDKLIREYKDIPITIDIAKSIKEHGYNKKFKKNKQRKKVDE